MASDPRATTLTTPLRQALRALLIGTALVAPLTTAAQAQTATAPLAAAQDEPAADDAATPEIVVTGTQLRGVAPVGSSLITVDRAQIEAINAVTTNQILQLQPQVFNFGVSESSRSGTGGAANITYGNAINLRGLSPFATLTLINGHRAVPAGTVGLAVDPSVIPTVMLERVDIVPDGASATYGSDAIAGVVNLITRRNFEGLQLGGRYGFGDDYHEAQWNALVGKRWGTGQITVGAEINRRSALSGLDRDFYAADLRSRGGADNRGTGCFPGTITANGVTYAIPAGGVTRATASQLVPNTVNRCDLLKFQDLLPEQKQYALAATFDQKITDGIRIFADAYYSHRAYTRQVPFASGPLTVTNANPYFVAPPGTNATSVVVDYFFGGQALGNTWTDRGTSENYTLSAGAEAKLWGDWQLTVYGSYGQNKDEAIQVRIAANSPQVAAALASTNPVTALNLFGPNSLETLQSINNDLFGAPGRSRQYVAEAKLDGTLISLRGGDVKLALGYQRQTDKVLNGLILGTSTASAPAFGGLKNLSRTANAFYGELLLPLFGPGNGVPGVERFEVDLGLRTTDFSDVGRTTNPKVGVNWTVVDGLKFTGSYGRSFRAPGLTQLVGPVSAVFVQTYATPTGPVLGYTAGGGNPELVPETATTWSLGAELRPSGAPGLSATVNYFNIDYRNQISSYLSNLNILQNPAAYVGIISVCPSSACTAQINRFINGTGPNPSPLPVFGPILPSPAVFVNGLEQNLATTKASGIDVDLRYRLDAGSRGTFNLGLSGTYYLNYELSQTPGAPVIDVVNRIGYPLRVRARGTLGWNLDGLAAFGFVNFQNDYTNDLATPVQQVASYTTVDLSVAYIWPAGSMLEGVKIGIDFRNLLDTDPPFVNIVANANGGGGFDPQIANPIGRVVGLSLSKRF